MQTQGIIHFDQALALHQQGDWHASLALLEVLIAQEPHHGLALAVAGVNALQLAQPALASSHLSRAAAVAPTNASIHYNLGVAREALEEFGAALGSYDSALALDKSLPSAHMNRGNVLRRLSRLDEALASLDCALQLQPTDGRAHYNRGVVLQDLGRQREALDAYAVALQAGFVTPEVFNNQGNAHLALHDFAHAAVSYAQSLALRGNDAQTLTNHAIALQEMCDLDGALASYWAALVLNPDASFVAGTVLYLQTQSADWSGYQTQLDGLARRLQAGVPVSPPFSLLSQLDDPALHRLAAAAWVQAKCPESGGAGMGQLGLISAPVRPGGRPIASTVVPPKGQRIRVGYFSCDFYDHATMRLFIEVMEAHDHEQFEWFAFSWGPARSDAMQDRVREAVDHFVDVDELPDFQIAQLAREWEIDVAIDLKGHTHGARPGIFVHRAAPVQAGFLGYPGSFGHGALDYILADRTVLPADQQVHYAEQICYLPGCYQPNGRYGGASVEVPDRIAQGLPPEGVVFCCFNATYKITPDVFSIWMRVLRKVEGSVLWLLGGVDATADHLRGVAEQLGVAPARLVFAPIKPHAAHLARYRCADLFLDTFPCGAHTTATDALREGLPVLTCTGQSFASRVAASVLAVLELPELVTRSFEDYESAAIKLALNADLLRSLASKVCKKCEVSDLFAPGQFAVGLETTVVELIARQCVESAASRPQYP